MPTDKQQLLEHRYAGDLAADIAGFVAEGLSWRQIAAHVKDNAGVTVSYETLRVWYRKDESEAVA